MMLHGTESCQDAGWSGVSLLAERWSACAVKRMTLFEIACREGRGKILRINFGTACTFYVNAQA
jgi:hypothetical protein